MGSESLPINTAQEMGHEMERKTKPATGQRVAYSGRYIRLVEDGDFRPPACMRWGQRGSTAKHGSPWLLAYPREVPESNRAEYLYRMVEEAKEAYNGAFGDGAHGDIYMAALVKRANILHAVVVGEDGKVRIKPWRVNCSSFVRASDDVELEAVDVGNVIYRGNDVAILEDRGNLWRAYVIPSTWLRPTERMAHAIAETAAWFKLLTAGRNVKAVAVQGLVWHGDIAYRPVVYGLDDVEYVVANESCAGFLVTAERVYFLR